MTDPIVDRIDALVRKRRSFVAGAHDAPRETAAADDDDVPVLTEVVDLSQISGEALGADATPPLQPMLDALAVDLIHAIEDRLAVELPELLEAAMERTRNELRHGIADALAAATRDFLARRQQLRLPFLDDEGG